MLVISSSVEIEARPLPEEAFAYGYQAEMKHFVECVRETMTPCETYEDGYIVNCILDAAYESMRSREWVHPTISKGRPHSVMRRPLQPVH